RVIADDPYVVVHVEGLPVEGGGSGRDEMFDCSHQNSTTDLSTWPAFILSNAGSTSAMPMRSDTNLSNGSRPCSYISPSIGKSRSGRQSRYQEDLSPPPRPNTSANGTVSSICGVGTPTSRTVPARSRP